MAEDETPNDRVDAPISKVYAVKIDCDGPAEFYVSKNGNVVLNKEDFYSMTEIALNGGSILQIDGFAGTMGLPPHIPVFIDCHGNVSGVFAAPTYINVYGGVVAVVREGLDIASVTRGNLYIGETQAERILLDSYGDDPVAFYES